MQGIKLQNVDPATFLRSFNKLADYYHSEGSTAKFEVKGFNKMDLPPLTKFPIPKYYEKMEGIYSGVTEKQFEDIDKVKQKFNQLDDRFMNNHRKFMAQTLNKMIEDNRSHIGIIQKSKTFYLLKEARKQNVQDKVRLGSREVRDVMSASNRRRESREHIPTNPEMYETDYKILTTDSYKNPQPIIFRGRKPEHQNPSLKMGSREEIQSKLASRRKKQPQQPPVPQTPHAQISRSSSSPMMKPKTSPSVQLNHDLETVFTKPLEDTDDIFHPDRYIRNRFQDPTVQLKYDYDRNQREASQKFKKRLAYHYMNDGKLKA